MARKLIMIAALTASVATAFTPVAAMAHDHDGYEWGRGDDRGYDNGYRDHDRRDYRDGYEPREDGRRYYVETGYDREYYGRPQYRYRCHRDGTTGAIIGAIAGGLLGNGLAGYGDRTLGTVLGGAGGALAGRAIERSGNRC